MPKRKAERGRPMERRYPPRIDATPDEIARVMLSGTFLGGAKPTAYECSHCGREVSYPETLYRDGRCEDCRDD